MTPPPNIKVALILTALMFGITGGLTYLIYNNYKSTQPMPFSVYSKEIHGDNYHFVIAHTTECDAQSVIDQVYNTMDAVGDKGYKDHLVDVLGAVVSDTMRFQRDCFVKGVTVYPDYITMDFGEDL